MPNFTIEVQDRPLREALDRLTRRLEDASPAMEDIARALQNHAEDAFQAERSPFGEPWRDLKPATKARRARRGHWPGAILSDTGGLAGSISRRAGANFAEVGAGKEYAAIHQFGGRAGMPPGPAAVPARPFLPIDQAGDLPESLKREVLDILGEYLR
ncbi:phage virion morphogenesis protein [Marichromatium gracile]|uniref:Phage virion morphogenesis protein n=1 Tax=Marichromatium gracile TaxID=1048 RepID=A0ABR5VIF6_MARGR|nr:phage virion morphogenesis protein [Marichromatium gracile]KXX64187.1 hypothetical protein AY586_14660 [Marichromatium gracile]